MTSKNRIVTGKQVERIVARLEEEIPRGMSRNIISGLSLALASREGTIWTGCFGYTDVTKAQRVNGDTLFGLQSTTKTITSVAGETDTSDNTFTCTVYIGVPGDVDGNQVVNMLDIYSIAQVYGARRELEPYYIPNSDVDDNGITNMIDLYTAAKHYGQTDP